MDACVLCRSKRTRREYLEDNYQFLCNCSRCQEENSDDETSEEEEDDEEYEPDSVA